MHIEPNRHYSGGDHARLGPAASYRCSERARPLRLLDSRLRFGLPVVRELPLRLEAVSLDTFGGLVTRPSTTHPRGALS
jgi:hypothetical protein